MLFSGLPWTRAADAATLAFAVLSRSVQAIDFTPIPSPNLDTSALGRVALVGDFDAISLYSFEGQSETPYSINGSQALLAQMPNGLFSTLAPSDGFIVAASPFVMTGGNLAGVVVGGNFTSLGNIQASAAALWSPKDNSIMPLPGLNGSVNAIYCSEATDSCFVGGSFHGANSTNAIIWIAAGEWVNTPFKGFDGPVNAISPIPNSGNVVFAGKFSVIANSSAANNQTANQQFVNLAFGGDGAVSSAPLSNRPGLSDPRNIICKTGNQDGPGNTWLLPDGVRGLWKKEITPFPFQPTTLRLYNTQFEGRGTKFFSFSAFPDHGLLNFTYKDPADGQNKWCIENCPLSSDATIPQDFQFVNPISMNGFQVNIPDNGWYGAGAGLDGIQIMQQSNNVYAESSFNAGNCSSAPTPANSVVNGDWKDTPANQNSANYLTVDLTGPGVNSGSASVRFEPNIQAPGRYVVNMITPGCIVDGTCQGRGIANVTAQYASDQPVMQSNIYQTNNFEKYDQIYNGEVQVSTGGFRPYIEIQPLDDQNNSITLVALRVEFILISESTPSSKRDTSSTVLNGLFEYNPNNLTVDLNYGSSAINNAGMNLTDDAVINNLATVGNTLYVAGDFGSKSGDFQNIFALANGQSSSLAQGGLNGPVTSMISWGNLLFVGGEFNNTKTGGTPLARGVMSYDTASNSWIPLGGGVNGAVDSVVPLQLNITPGVTESCITVNGDFNQVLPGTNTEGFNTSEGFAIWVPGRNNWLQNLNVPQPAISGKLTYAVNYTGSTALLAGTISSQGLAIQDVVSLSAGNGNASISSLGLQEPSVASRGQDKAIAAMQSQANITGAVTGLFDLENGKNTSIIGGNFETSATNGSTVRNLVFINTESNGTNTITGIADGINANSTFLTLARRSGDRLLYAGGVVTGQANGESVNGIVVWDMDKSGFADAQPPALTGSNVSVNVITIRPTHTDVYAGGRFDGVEGGLPCSGLCVYNNGQWNAAGNGFSGVVDAQMWQSNDNLLLGGNFTVGGNQSMLARYDANSQMYTTIGGASVPGPVNVLTPANLDGSQYWLAGTATNGSSYMMKYDGSNFRTIPALFGEQSVIRGLSILSLQDGHAHDSTDLLDGNYVVMVTGSLNVSNFVASAVLFNGTTLMPFILSNSGNNPGSMSQLISERPQNFTTGGRSLALGFVVLIALAIALGLIFILVLIGMALERWRRRREGYRPAPQNYVEKTANMGRIPPDQLLGNLGRGTEGPRI